MGSLQLPILILSFNRPRYLQQVLDSLKSQESIDLSERRVALFQDGSWSPSLKKHHTDQSLISENISLFKAQFPHGTVFDSEVNLGTALNIDRAERYAFEELGAPAAVFLEDDLVLGSSYLKVLEKLIGFALEDERIGYVAAFGNFQAPKEIQIERQRLLRPLHLLWGFGLTQRHWRKCRPYVKQYLDLIRNMDYSARDHEAIRRLVASWGIEPGDTAQDRIKAFATALAGAVKINTEVSYAKYIGERGINFTPELFAKWGFNNHAYFDEPFSLDFDTNSVNFDPWHSGTNIWKIKTQPEREDVVVSKKSLFSRLADDLFGESPYAGYACKTDKLDVQNWNSTHPALSRLVREIKPKIIVDLGVWKGLSTITLAKAQSEVAAEGIVIAVDTFLGSPEHWTRSRPDVHSSLRFKNGRPNFYETFLANMVLSELDTRVLPVTQTSENAALILHRNGIRPELVHIDAAHEFEPVLRDIRVYYDLLCPGGILIGDDFNWPGVARAVVHFTDAMQLGFTIEHPKWIIRKPL